MTRLSQQLKEASSKLKVNRNTVHWVDVNCPALDCAPPSPTSLPLPPFPTSLLSLLFFPSPLLPPSPCLPCLLHPSLPSFLTQERSSKLHQTTTTLQAVQSECATYKNMAEGYQEEYERATAKLNVRSPLFVSPHSPTPSSSFLYLPKTIISSTGTMAYLRFSPSWVEPGLSLGTRLAQCHILSQPSGVHQPCCTLLIVAALQYRIAEDSLGGELEM